ncbi:uncharacterized protein LOC129892810 [Solanum dulcamara]|uniref:uncharacterized protein LOC129892810 n=1 Tax=Solanum dulcamara TaxID=45834 RepID=UPI002484F7C8|nr:uncharacterized protein LOC129892810 [Solanum dulcamara]
MHKDVIPPNESEKTVSPDNVPGAKSAVGGESSGHLDQIVDQKFKHLENKIDSNHIDLLKAVDSIASRMISTSSQLKTDDFDQTFHVVEQQQAPTGLEVHNFGNKSDPPQANDQSNVQEDIKVDNISEQNISSDVPKSFDQHVSSDTLKEDEPSIKIQEVDDVSEQNIVADDIELFDQHMSSDTLKEPEISIFTPQLKDVSAHQMKPQRADTDQRIADSDTLQNTAKKDVRVAIDKTDKVEEQVEEIEKEKIKPNTSESNTSTPFLTETLDVIDSLIYGLPLPAMPLTVVTHEQVVQDECLLRDSQLPTTLPSKPNVLSDDAKTPFRRSRIPSKILQLPYLSNFGSSKKDFVVAFSKDKNWFYLISQPNRCWNDKHINVIFYYLRKKSKIQLSNQYRYTTTNCIFKIFIEYAHTCYYHIPPDISTQEDMARAIVTAHHERSVKNIIRDFSILARLPWHVIDEVYIAVNCDRDFHWVLAVVVLKKRFIRVYDSLPRRRSSNSSQEIQKIAAMLLTYLQDSGFFDNNERTDWSSLDSYKDKSTGNMLEPHHPFAFEYVEGIAQQGSDSLDCGVFLTIFAEYFSDGIFIPNTRLNTEFFHSSYVALLWRYGCQKAMDGYVSDNDDPKKPRSDISPSQGELIDVQ